MPERGKPLVGVGFGVVRVAVVFALLLAVAQGDWYTIQEALVAAGDVYEEPDFITKKYSADDRTVVVDTASDIQFFVTQDLHSQQIAVRGSFTVLNWLQDAYLPLVKSSKYDLKAAIHQGFLIGAEAIFERIKELGASKKLVLQKELQTSLIGHSLGGAVATVLGMLLLEDGFDPANILIYTYGAPRVTDRCGAAAYADLPLLRVKNEADIVTMVPPSPPFFHIGWGVVLYDNATYARLEDMESTARNHPPWEAFSSSLSNLDENSQVQPDPRKHFFASYTTNIAAGTAASISRAHLRAGTKNCDDGALHAQVLDAIDLQLKRVGFVARSWFALHQEILAQLKDAVGRGTQVMSLSSSSSESEGVARADEEARLEPTVPLVQQQQQQQPAALLPAPAPKKSKRLRRRVSAL